MVRRPGTNARAVRCAGTGGGAVFGAGTSDGLWIAGDVNAPFSLSLSLSLSLSMFASVLRHGRLQEVLRYRRIHRAGWDG
jgi:hypothetical protein